MATEAEKLPRILSGMRPTGKLHLGNYVGALANWVELQNSGRYDCFFFIADWHALTSDYADTSPLKNNVLEVMLDYLAAGLDPDKSVLFLQSHVPQHAELFLLLSMITPLGWLERVPTYKEQLENIKDRDLGTYGFLGYPVLQAADILIYRGEYVPVGEDQVSHLEFTREVARRFNHFYPAQLPPSSLRVITPGDFEAHVRQFPGTAPPQIGSVIVREGHEHELQVFPEPQPLLTPMPKLRGSDGRKMSKSYGNTILLADDPNSVSQKVASYVTDRPTMVDKGDPDRCPVGDLHKNFSAEDVRERSFHGCRTASISCQQCKTAATDSVLEQLKPIQLRRSIYAKNPGSVWAHLQRGSATANQTALRVIEDVRAAMGMSHSFQSLVSSYPWAAGQPDAFLNISFDETESIRDHTQRGDRRREAWLRFVRRYCALRETDVHRVYTTPTNRRVCVVTAGEDDFHDFRFLPRDRTYELLVLLFHLRDGTIVEAILPSRFFRPFWKNFLRRDGSVEISASRTDGNYFIAVPGQNKVSVTEFKARYDLLK